MNEVIVDGVLYVKKNKNKNNLPYVIVRTYSAGVFAGFLKKRNKKEVTLLKARRLWYWEGAATLSQLAMEGVNKPEKCKFPVEVENITLLEAIEIIPCTAKAKKSIEEVDVWCF